MKKVDLNKVLEMLINEEHAEATGLLHEWFVETTKSIHEELMTEGDELSSDIKDDQEAIKAEEFYSEAEGDDEADKDLDGDVDAGADAEGNDEVEGEVEVDAEADLGDTIEDLEAVMARLKAEYAKITGDADVDGDAEGDMDMEMDMDGDNGDDTTEVEFGADGDVDVETDESFVPVVETEEDDSEEMTEDFADLEESWSLEPVKDPNLDGGKEIGANGAKVSVNDKSPLPNKKPADRFGGKAVEIKATEHKGYDREAAPEVKAKPLLKNQVKNATDGRSSVSKEGDKSAMLNSKAGFGSDSPKSPIGAGAADLRGSDFKRK